VLAAVGLAAGLDLDAIAKGLRGGWAAPHRAELVRLRGTTIVDDQEIPGITGGALDSDEGAPGPIMLQGDHGPIEFRNLTIASAR